MCRGSLACFDAAARRNAFGRALRTTMGSEAVASLRATLVNRARMSTELDRIEPDGTELNGTELNGTERMAPRVDHNSEHG